MLAVCSSMTEGDSCQVPDKLVHLDNCFWQDVLVVTAPGSGAEIIPFLKTYLNLPLAIAFTVAYTKVRDRFLYHSFF